MAACDFDMRFTFVLPGWEGNAHDTRIFYSTIRDTSKNFPMPPKGKYYLVNAGNPNTSGFLAPYKGQKYHMPDFQRASVYKNRYETFNHLYSSLCGTIERSFGIWKKIFAMLTDMSVNIMWSDQIALVSATMVIHNFIRKDFEDDFMEYENNVDYYEDDIETTEIFWTSDVLKNYGNERVEIITFTAFATTSFLLSSICIEV